MDDSMSEHCDIAIVGAGPYGLSLAAHLSAEGRSFRIFGKPLETWRAHMPIGMQLKSDGFASNLSAPDPDSTLKAYCAARGLAYDDRHLPVSLALFNDYAQWFQQSYVPMLEEKLVCSLSGAPGLYALTLDDGSTVMARRVVLAIGIGAFAHWPAEFEGLPDWAVSHSYDHHALDRLSGKNVLVLGAGASAIDIASLLADSGAAARLLARAPHIHFHSQPDPDNATWLRQIAHPSSGIGPGWRSFLCSNAPGLFHRMPERFRLAATRRHLGPAPGWFMRARFEGQVETLLGHELIGASARGGVVMLQTRDASGRETSLSADHVIAATGYRTDLARLGFLDSRLRRTIAQVAGTPRLSDTFETSRPGLYVIGPAAANSFGPLMRFMVGAEYVAPRLARHLAREASRKAA